MSSGQSWESNPESIYPEIIAGLAPVEGAIDFPVDHYSTEQNPLQEVDTSDSSRGLSLEAPKADAIQDLSSDTGDEVGSMEYLQTGQAAFEPQKKKWGVRLAVGAAALGAAFVALPHAEEAKNVIIDNLSWAAPVLLTSEAAWNAGMAMMLIAAGQKVGNPLKLHSRLKNLSDIVVEAADRPLFKAGMATNIAGEVGTASVLIWGSVAELPPSTWPLTIGVSAALATPAVVAWTALWRAKHAQKVSRDTQD